MYAYKFEFSFQFICKYTRIRVYVCAKRAKEIKFYEKSLKRNMLPFYVGIQLHILPCRAMLCHAMPCHFRYQVFKFGFISCNFYYNMPMLFTIQF